MYLFMGLSLACVLYYVICASYAGISSSFIFIWLVGALLFGGIFAFMYMENKNIYELPVLVKRLAAVIIGLVFLMFFIIEALIIGSMSDEPSDDCKYMLVLGCRIKGTTVTKSLKKRLDTAYEYSKDNEEITIIVSGGQGRGEDISEAEAMKAYLVERGIDSSRIIMEDKSVDTSENIRFSAKLIDNMEDGVCVVSNNFHIYRAKKLARGAGFKNVSGAAAGSDPVLLLNYMVREAVGVVKELVFGYF